MEHRETSDIVLTALAVFLVPVLSREILKDLVGIWWNEGLGTRHLYFWVLSVDGTMNNSPWGLT